MALGSLVIIASITVIEYYIRFSCSRLRESHVFQPVYDTIDLSLISYLLAAILNNLDDT